MNSPTGAGRAAAARFAAAIAALERYVEIEALSPAFDPDWAAHGEIARATELVADHLRTTLPDAHVEIVSIEGRTPIVLGEIDPSPGASARGTALIYGHLDKQPPLGDWREGLAPFRAVREGDRLYGRGAADDGYAGFCAAAALAGLAQTSTAHGRVVILLEASEESGSPDLDAYLELLDARLGELDLVVCLDAGALDYDRLWATSSVRGNLTATLRVDVLEYGVHSGLAGGLVPSSFRIARALLSRVEDERTGEILLRSARVEVPEHRRREIAEVVELVGESATGEFPLVGDLRLQGTSAADRLERNAWGAALAVIGAGGLPDLAEAGNVLRPQTSLRLSLRLPPSADADAVAAELVEVLTSDPPEGARVAVEVDLPGHGFEAPATAPWLHECLTGASTAYFGAPPAAVGLGGSIPFLHSLQARHPHAQFLVTGVLGPESNAHGVNESLHVPTATALAACLADVLAALG